MTTILDIPGTNPPNPFSTPIQSYLTPSNISSAPSPKETANHLVNTVTTSSAPAHALWELWDAFFTSIATSPSYETHITLLDAIQAQPPTQLNLRAKSALRKYIGTDGKLHWQTLPLFGAQWREVHDTLEAWRDWDGVRDLSVGVNSVSALSSSCDKYFLRFCVFSAALLKSPKGKGMMHPIWVFYACRDVLEREGPQSCQPKAHRMSSEQVWELDVRIAAIWMRDGGRALWETDYDELRRDWAAALDDPTELWPREDGLTRERWGLWEERLRVLGTKEIFNEETRAVVTEAAEVVSSILEDST
ncbi:uncharacterized protein PGRI_001000 [Penicillium griseofulvum]|uniref:Uncharacterized protein n=1 Tax=Penicillium patulum TaxID=5078 RepID=A0A135LVQ3_PENPA|nr:uncharacterized protein PGRI_001000 [Penicillium griseofulvum]KXG53050.1 hypothetical protein PGRI_001000 [Penicillium griseofulvum]